MVETVIEFSRYFIAMTFGSAVEASLAGMARMREITWLWGA